MTAPVNMLNRAAAIISSSTRLSLARWNMYVLLDYKVTFAATLLGMMTKSRTANAITCVMGYFTSSARSAQKVSIKYRKLSG
jgi:hypothetical protein